MLQRVIDKGWVVGIGFLIGAMLIAVANIAARLLGGSITPAYELIELMTVVAVTFALVYVTLKKGHVAVHILVSRLSPRTQAILDSFTLLFGLGTWAMITWASFELMSKKWLGEISAVLEIPFLPFRIIWVFGLFLFCLVILTDLFEVLRQAVRK